MWGLGWAASPHLTAAGPTSLVPVSAVSLAGAWFGAWLAWLPAVVELTAQ